MPLIYGEGRKAFMRLQLEIIKKTDDDSIFAWAADMSSSGLLATWPTAFAGSGTIVQIVSPEDHMPWLPPTMTSIGLEMKGRYERNDPRQASMDAQYNVHTINTAFFTADHDEMVMHCSPCDADNIPITQNWKQNQRGKALLLRLKRVGATWQRVNCRSLEFCEYAMGKPGRFDAYAVYYIKQQGL